MSFRPDLYTNDVRQRYKNVKEVPGGRECFSTNVYRAQKDIDLMNKLGIILGSEKEVPTTGGQPRIFLIRQDKDGRDKVMTMEEAGIKYGSKEFWTEAQLGNAYAYPAGDTRPVQIQFDWEKKYAEEEAYPKISFSKPIEPEDLPSAPVKEPGGWAKFCHFITFGRAYKKQFEEYNNAIADKAAVAAKVTGMNSLRESAASSELSIKETIAAAEEKKRKEAEEAFLKPYKNAADLKEHVKDNFESIYKPVPVMKEELLKRMEDETGPEGKVIHPKKEGYYTKENFDDLTVLSPDSPDPKNRFDLKDIKVGNSSRSVTESEFCAAAMIATMRPKIMMDVYPKKDSYDKYLIDTLKAHGYTEEEAEEGVCTHASGGSVTDLFFLPARDSSGKWISSTINKGRLDAKKAFEEYKNSNKGPLAEIIAYGINNIAGTISSSSYYVSEDYMKSHIAGNLINMMDDDPELKKAAFKAGLDEKKLGTVKGSLILGKMDDERKKAKLKLANAENDGTVLTEDEKKKCVEDIVRADILENMYLNDNANQSPEYNKLKYELDHAQIASANEFELWKKEPEKRPPAKDGKFWADSTAFSQQSLLIPRAKPNKVLQDINTQKSRDDLELITKTICSEKQLQKKSPGEILKSLNNSNHITPEVMKKFDSMNKPLEEKTVENNIQKQNDGPVTGTALQA